MPDRRNAPALPANDWFGNLPKIRSFRTGGVSSSASRIPLRCGDSHRSTDHGTPWVAGRSLQGLSRDAVEQALTSVSIGKSTMRLSPLYRPLIATLALGLCGIPLWLTRAALTAPSTLLTHYDCAWTDAPPTLDGNLDDTAWKSAAPI